MSSAKKWQARFRRESPIKLNAGTAQKHLKRIGGIAERNKTHALMSRVRITLDGEKEKDAHVYEGIITVTKGIVRKPEAAERQYLAALDKMIKTAENHGWKYVDGDVQRPTPQVMTELPPQNLDFIVPQLTTSILKETTFARVYERDPHIRTIHAATETAVSTHFDKRRHVLLYGPPACAKSEILRKFVDWYNSVNEIPRVLALDSTTTTKAGLETLILEMAKDGTLPPILYLEEIEKYDLAAQLCLLAIMDQRGRIQRTNARIGNVWADAKVVVWATCNDLKKLKNFEGGALWSRFSRRLYCSRPTEELMRQILVREAADMNVSDHIRQEVIDKIVRFGYDELESNDAREFIALLDGWRRIDSYLDDQRAILAAKRRDEEQDAIPLSNGEPR